ncbi:hypothetical protein [Tabrizicola sp.]|uniref:hypothetical protein n=1 Tax=Tabrizicola sp. TaxID=2005166 RepID=UPI002736B3F5|nr:hypothetical protein [Tabrizicola sp.]MDP3197474.1 hypothetical protein [Tabrizicola sp.]
MLWGKKVLQVSAVLAVAFGAAHTAEKLKAPAAQHSLLLTAADVVRAPRTPSVQSENPAVPQSASLSSPTDTGLGQVTGITTVAAAAPGLVGEGCQARLSLLPLPGAMIEARLTAPCNRGERFVVRHSGLSFSAQTQADGRATVILPALRSDAMVAVYLQDSRLVLGRLTVPDAATYARYAISWDSPVEMELRVTEGDRVLIGSAALSGLEQGVIALGQTNLPSPVLARVYSVPGKDLGKADITGELRITPATCGRTLRVETAHSSGGVAFTAEHSIAVPMCGTAGDILVLKNLAPPLKLAAPK